MGNKFSYQTFSEEINDSPKPVPRELKDFLKPKPQHGLGLQMQALAAVRGPQGMTLMCTFAVVFLEDNDPIFIHDIETDYIQEPYLSFRTMKCILENANSAVLAKLFQGPRNKIK